MNCYRLLDISKRPLQTTKSHSIKHIRWCSDWKSLDPLKYPWTSRKIIDKWFSLHPWQISIDNKCTTNEKEDALFFLNVIENMMHGIGWETVQHKVNMGCGAGGRRAQTVDLPSPTNIYLNSVGEYVCVGVWEGERGGVIKRRGRVGVLSGTEGGNSRRGETGRGVVVGDEGVCSRGGGGGVRGCRERICVWVEIGGGGKERVCVRGGGCGGSRG